MSGHGAVVDCCALSSSAVSWAPSDVSVIDRSATAVHKNLNIEREESDKCKCKMCQLFNKWIVSLLEVCKLFVNQWLEDHPERLHEEEVVLLLAAFFETFSCTE